MDHAQLTANLAQQQELYGAPLGDSIRHVGERLGLSQAAIGRVLGVSAPMLSQLVSGQRIKLGNPLAVHRLGRLVDLAEEVDAGLAHDQVAARLGDIADSAPTLTTQRASTPPAVDPRQAVAVVQGLLHAVASGRQLRDAADTLEAAQPEVAELLRVYAGPPDAAVAHYRSVQHLL